MFNVILAMDLRGGIGRMNQLPWKFSEDMKYFKHLTTNPVKKPVVIMGRKTLQSFNKIVGKYQNYNNNIVNDNYNSLVNRINIVISGDTRLSRNNDIYYVKSFDEALSRAYSFNTDVWVIGGSSIYNMAFRHQDLNKIFLTRIDYDFDCDTFVHIPKNIVNSSNIIRCEDKNNGRYHNLYFEELQPIYTAEQQYLKLLNKVINTGKMRETRNGKTLSIFSEELKFDVSQSFPLLTTKKMFLRGIIEELLFFIRGETDTIKLSEKSVRIWEGNTSQEFLDKLSQKDNNFKLYKVGEMGPMYGYQWRFFNKIYNKLNCQIFQKYMFEQRHSDFNDWEQVIQNGDKWWDEFIRDCENDHINCPECSEYIDQFANLIELIKKDKHSRRLLMTDFNPLQADEGVLFPCHSLLLQFYCQNGRLSVKMYQRSADLFLGLPFNIASTTLLLYIVAKLVDMEPGYVSITLGDCHIYADHIEQVKRQLSRTPYEEPIMTITDFKTIEEVENAKVDDFVLSDYECHKGIKAQMIA
jgi:dihydrofolate reductase/thymidylate synthase